MDLIKAAPAANDEPVKIDPSVPEYVLFEITGEERHFSNIVAYEIGGADDVMGIVSYEQSYGVGVEFLLEDVLEEWPAVGFWVMEGITGAFFRGDGWTTDDDVEFYGGTLRPATQEEVSGYVL
jgi:hypothetical protein